jgi:hypothetical protein
VGGHSVEGRGKPQIIKKIENRCRGPLTGHLPR